MAFPYGDTHGDDSYYHKRRVEVDLSLTKNLLGFDTQWKLYWNDEDLTDHITSYVQGFKVLERKCTPDRSWRWLAHFVKPLGSHRIGFGADTNYLGMGGTHNIYVRDDYFAWPPPESDDEWDATCYHDVYVDDIWNLLN